MRVNDLTGNTRSICKDGHELTGMSKLPQTC